MRRIILWLIGFCFLFLNACNALPGKQNASGSLDKTTSASQKTSAPDAPDSESTASDPRSTASSSESDTTAPDPSTLSNTMMAWWFMRTEDHTQPSAQEEIDLTKYDSWYVKTNLKEGEKPVFLTFDCGYENGFTPGILDVLKKHNAPAAFFVCKHFIKDQPELIKRMKKEGHIVGNHTANHICMPETKEREIRKEIADNASYMKEATGYDMDHFFRPPKGEYSERTLQITKNMGYTTVFWSMAYLDYDVNKQPGAQYVIDHFNKYIHPGAIPLIHNISQSNAEALDTVLTNLEKEGYSFHSLKDLIV